MRETRCIVVLATAALAAAGLSWAEPPRLAFYVGQDVCVECHVGGRGARPCSLDPIPAHDRSYDALSDPRAAEIAALSGVPEAPRKSRVCLDCHATSAVTGARWTTATFNLEDGVQCESCHDAGSLHVEAYRTGEQRPREGHDSIRRVDDSICEPCHRERPSHTAVLERGYRRSAADLLYKTPVNLAIAPDGRELYVVCERSDSLIVLDPEAGEVLHEIAVGKRPQDVAVDPSGRTLYVTNRLSDTLSVIDVGSRRVVDEIAVGDGPHGVLAEPTGHNVFVLNTAQDSISVVDTAKRTEVRQLVAGRSPWSPVLGPDGETLLVTNVRPNPVRFREPPRSEITAVSAGRGVVVRRATVPDANMLQGIDVIPGTAVIFTLMRTKNLVPVTRLAQGWVITNGLGIVWPDGRVDQLLLDEPDSAFPDPTDVAVSPDGRHALVTSGGSDQVAVVDVEKLLSVISEASPRERVEILPNHLGTSSRFVVGRISVGSNPRGVLFSPDGRFAYVANALDDSVSVIETTGFTVARDIALGGPAETTELRRGEKLFHNASNVFGRQFSCRSCHPDGHVNGLTFDIEADGIGLLPVDNRTLRGILDTPPFKWAGTNPSLRQQCGPRFAKFFARLEPFSSSDLDALVRYISTIERPPNRHRPADGLTLSQRRGQLIFERTTGSDGKQIPLEQRCTTCHNGAYRTSRTKSTVGTTMWFDGPIKIEPLDIHDADSFGDLGILYYSQIKTWQKEFDTPHLNNIYEDAPFLHNGGAATLEEVWTRFNIYDWHGLTSDLTRRQFNDLMAYVRAL
jgi:YVTN family beta-propeller protein